MRAMMLASRVSSTTPGEVCRRWEQFRYSLSSRRAVWQWSSQSCPVDRLTRHPRSPDPPPLSLTRRS